jgi:hypothetical protein
VPFVDSTIQGFQPQIDNTPTTSTATFSELFDTALYDTTPGMISQAVSFSQPADGKLDPSFDPYTKDNITGYEPYADSFIHVRNADDMALMKKKIDTENEHNRALSEGGIKGVAAALAAGLLDPVNLIPIGGELNMAYKLGKIGSIAEGAYRVGRAGLMSSVATEAIAQGTQETRTAEQSAKAIATTTLLAGILGGGAGAFGRDANQLKTLTGNRSLQDFSAGVERDLDDYARESVGAAAVPTTTREQETLSSALGMEKLVKYQDPLMRTTQSQSLETRRAIQDLAEIPLRFKKNEEGIASPIAVESMMKRWQGPLSQSFDELDNAYTKYRLGRDKRFGDIARIGATDIVSSQEKLGYLAFREEVGKALRRGDTSEIPEVAEAAKTFRQRVFDPLKEEAIRAKLLPEDVSVDTALSYFSRVYNTEKIIRRRPEFEGRITQWLTEEQGKAAQRLTRATKDLNAEAAKLAERDRLYSGLTKDDLEQIAQQITDTLIADSPIRTHYGPIPLARGPLKERTLGIPDEMIEDFLHNDVMHVARRYTRTMAADVELTKKFGRADLQDQVNKITDEYAKLRLGVTGEAKLKKLDDAMRADLRDITAVRDRLRGTYALPPNVNGLVNRSFNVMRNLNYMRLLGGAMLGSIPDAARVVMAHGILRTFKDGLIPLVTNLKQVKLSAQEVKLAGTALDMALDTRAMALGEITDLYGRGTRFERGLSAASEQFGMVSLLSPWTAAMKQFYGTVAQTRSLKAIEALADGSITAKERTRLAQFGIGESDAKRIAKMFTKHGEKDGAYWANTAKWEDRKAATVYRAALVKDVDRAIITPGQDKPLWMSTPLGKVVSQFRSYALASTQRAMLAGLQERDLAQLNGLMLSTGLGMVAYWLKNGNDKLSDDPAVWVKEGVDRAGVTGWFFDANNVAEKLSRNTIGLSSALGQPASGRYASRNAIDSLLGPTFGLTKDAVDLMGSASTGEWTDADTHRLRKMLPLQNLFYARKLFDAAEGK